MATGGVKKKLPSKASVPVRNSSFDRLPVDVVNSHKPIGEEIMGWIAACVLIALLLPLMGFLYLDILEAKNEVKSQYEKVEKIRREIEKEKRDANTNRP
jgi:hypothetical protein